MVGIYCMRGGGSWSLGSYSKSSIKLGCCINLRAPIKTPVLTTSIVNKRNACVGIEFVRFMAKLFRLEVFYQDWKKLMSI